MLIERLWKVTCPCCGKERNIKSTPLLEIEQRLREKEKWPWWGSSGWSVREAKKGTLQWACGFCLKEGRAIASNPEAQTFCDYPPYLAYYDVTLRCGDCSAQFIFSAKEQQYWYEQLRFWVQSRPKQCAACRHTRRERNQKQGEKLKKP